MDGISSASGIFAIVSIAIQLGDGVHKLHTFWCDVEGAPQYIRDLLEELKSLSALIKKTKRTVPASYCDHVSHEILKSCDKKISALYDKSLEVGIGLQSTSRRKRQWAAFKFAFKKQENLVQEVGIDRAKNTLQLLLLGHLQENFTSQQQIVTEIRDSINSLPIEIGRIYQLHYNRMQILQQIQLDNTQAGPSLVASEDDSAVETCSAGCLQSKVNARMESGINARDLAIHKSQVISNRIKIMRFPFFNLGKHSFIKTRATQLGNGAVDSHFSYILYPSSGMLRFFSRGLWIDTTSTSGWQFSLKPFTVVPEESLTFDFCHKGNLEAVKTILQSGKASLRDRDPHGQTPLWYATEGEHYELVEFLLREGADPHVVDFRGNQYPPHPSFPPPAAEANIPSSPIYALIFSRKPSAAGKIAIIRLFHTYVPEGFEKYTILNLLSILLLFYRPGKMDQPLSPSQRCEAAISILRELLPYFPPGDVTRSDILNTMLHFSYQRDALRFMIEHTEFIHPRPERPVLHDELRQRLRMRDPQSLRDIMRKMGNWHLVATQAYPSARVETPTSLAMYQAASFFAWRDAVVELGTDLRAFVRRELDAGVLSGRGWNEDALVSLFEADYWDTESEVGIEGCDRCGPWELSRVLVVDLVFQRYLRRVRTRRWRCAIQEIRMVLNGAVEEEKGEEGVVGDEYKHVGTVVEEEQVGRELPYRFVCAGVCTKDGVCVAWAYEVDGADEPDLPSFPVCRVIEELEDEYPSRRMPGSFDVE